MEGLENLKITEGIKNDLLTSAKWTKFLAVTGTVAMVITALAGLCMLFFCDGAAEKAMGVCYVIVIALYVYPLKKMFNIVRTTREAMNDVSQESLEQATSNLLSLTKFMGILTIIVLVIYAIAIIGGIIAGVSLLGRL